MLLDAPPIPDGCAALWEHFLALHESRGNSGFGPARLSWRDLGDWQSFTGLRLAGWQVVAIRKADDAFMADWAERNPPPKAADR